MKKQWNFHIYWWLFLLNLQCRCAQWSNGSLVVSSIDNLPDREILEISTDINCLIAWVISWIKGEQRKSHGKKTKGNLFWRPVMRPIIINVFSCDQTLWRNQKYPPKIPFKWGHSEVAIRVKWFCWLLLIPLLLLYVNNFFCWLLIVCKMAPLPLIDMRRPCVITEERCKLVNFDTYRRGIHHPKFKHYALPEAPLSLLSFLHFPHQ